MTKKQRLRVLAVMMVALVILPFIMEPENTLGWLYNGWQSGDSRVNFVATFTKNPEFTMWIYDTEDEGAPEGASAGSWREINQLDKSEDSNKPQSEPLKPVEPAGAFSDNALNVSNQYDLHFGNILSLAEVYEENCIYARFKVTLNENSQANVFLNYSLPANADDAAYYEYLHLYKIGNDGATLVPDNCNLMLQLNRIGDGGQPFYPFMKAYCTAAVYANAYEPDTMPADMFSSDNCVELTPSGISLQLKDGEDTTVKNANGVKRIVYVYMKFVPDVKGISNALCNVAGLDGDYKSLRALGPFYAVMNVNLDMEVQIERSLN